MTKRFSVTLEEGHDAKKALEVLEAAYIEHSLQNNKYNQSKASKELGISRGALRYKAKNAFGDKYIGSR